MFLPIKQTITIFQLSKTTKSFAKTTLFSYIRKFSLQKVTNSFTFLIFCHTLPLHLSPLIYSPQGDRTSSAVDRCAVVRFAALHCRSLAMLAVDFSRVYRRLRRPLNCSAASISCSLRSRNLINLLSTHLSSHFYVLRNLLPPLLALHALSPMLVR